MHRTDDLRRLEHGCRCERNRCRAIVGDKFLWTIVVYSDSQSMNPNKQSGLQEQTVKDQASRDVYTL